MASVDRPKSSSRISKLPLLTRSIFRVASFGKASWSMLRYRLYSTLTGVYPNIEASSFSFPSMVLIGKAFFPWRLMNWALMLGPTKEKACAKCERKVRCFLQASSKASRRMSFLCRASSSRQKVTRASPTPRASVLRSRSSLAMAGEKL